MNSKVIFHYQISVRFHNGPPIWLCLKDAKASFCYDKVMKSNDSIDGLDPSLVSYLDDSYFRHLPNVGLSNPKLLVVFSGGNALGKTSIAKRVENQLGGLIIATDDIKEHILKYQPEIDQKDLNVSTWKYSMGLYSRLEELTPNGLVVRDSVIDWYHDRILPIFKNTGYELFVIGFDVSAEKRKELINGRGDKSTVSAASLIEQIPEHIQYADEFRKIHKPDVLLNEDNLFDQIGRAHV